MSHYELPKTRTILHTSESFTFSSLITHVDNKLESQTDFWPDGKYREYIFTGNACEALLATYNNNGALITVGYQNTYGSHTQFDKILLVKTAFTFIQFGDTMKGVLGTDTRSIPERTQDQLAKTQHWVLG